MFKVNEYKIVFKRRWHQTRIRNDDPAYSSGFITLETDGRYDTVCEIYINYLEVPHFTGVARLHPNDKPDKIVGKKVALRNAISQSVSFNRTERTAIWKAFWEWVADWKKV
jgi:hypothetical protein